MATLQEKYNGFVNLNESTGNPLMLRGKKGFESYPTEEQYVKELKFFEKKVYIFTDKMFAKASIFLKQLNTLTKQLEQYSKILSKYSELTDENFDIGNYFNSKYADRKGLTDGLSAISADCGTILGKKIALCIDIASANSESDYDGYWFYSDPVTIAENYFIDTYQKFAYLDLLPKEIAHNGHKTKEESALTDLYDDFLSRIIYDDKFLKQKKAGLGIDFTDFEGNDGCLDNYPIFTIENKQITDKLLKLLKKCLIFDDTHLKNFIYNNFPSCYKGNIYDNPLYLPLWVLLNEDYFKKFKKATMIKELTFNNSIECYFGDVEREYPEIFIN